MQLNAHGRWVYDTPRPTADGRVPSHDVNGPSGRRQNETWEDYEARVLAEPEAAFSPDVRIRSTDIAGLVWRLCWRLRVLIIAGA